LIKSLRQRGRQEVDDRVEGEHHAEEEGDRTGGIPDDRADAEPEQGGQCQEQAGAERGPERARIAQ
jgi:hypothetical protein